MGNRAKMISEAERRKEESDPNDERNGRYKTRDKCSRGKWEKNEKEGNGIRKLGQNERKKRRQKGREQEKN